MNRYKVIVTPMTMTEVLYGIIDGKPAYSCMFDDSNYTGPYPYEEMYNPITNQIIFHIMANSPQEAIDVVKYMRM